jgi:hypothetical protein
VPRAWLPDQPCVLGARHAADDRDQALQALGGHAVRHGLFDAHRRGAVPGGELEGVGVVVADGFHERDGVLEVVLGLAGEPDDEIGRERDRRDSLPQRRDHLKVALARIAPQHALERAVRSALRGEVDVLAHRGRLGHRGQHRRGEGGGVR